MTLTITGGDSQPSIEQGTFEPTTLRIAEIKPESRYRLKSHLKSRNDQSCTVWLATDKRLGNLVVLNRYDHDAGSEAFEHERDILTRGLPFIPHLVDVFVDSRGRRTIVREYIPGKTLQEVVPEHRALPGHKAVSIAAQLCDLVEILNSCKQGAIGFASLTVDQIVLDEDGQLWVVDASSAADADGALTARQIESIGRMALYLATATRIDETKRPSEWGVPKPFAEVLARAISTDANERYGSVQWFGLALRELETLLTLPETRPVPPFPRPVFHAVDLDESPVAHAISNGEAGSLEWAKLADAALSLRGERNVGGLHSLDSLEMDFYTHQIEAARKVVSSPDLSAGAILADEVGLGKTIEALIVCQELRATKLAESVLIIASPSGAPQWLSETRTRIRSNAFERGFRLYSSVEDAGYPLLIVSSATIKQERHLKQFLDKRYDLVIVDEAHQCCGGDGNLSALGRAVDSLRRKRLLLLSATPLGNRLWDLFCLVDLIRPGYLGTRQAFASEYVSSSSGASLRDLRARTNTLMIRHKRSDLREIVTPTVEFVTALVDPPEEGKSEMHSKISAASGLISQAWKDERVVVFARSTAARAALARRIRKDNPGRTVVEFQGNRRESREFERQFNDYADAVILSGDTVAEGMNWQRARCLLHFDAPLSPLAWEQRIGRIYRIGQKASSLEIVHLAVENSLEAAIFSLLGEDLGLFDLPIGEAVSLLDCLDDGNKRNVEGRIRGLMSANLSARAAKLSELSDAFCQARDRYSQQSVESRMLDDLYFGFPGE